MAQLISLLSSDFSKEDFTLGSSFWAFQLLFLKYLPGAFAIFLFKVFSYKEFTQVNDDKDGLLEYPMLGKPLKFPATQVQEFIGQVTQLPMNMNIN